MSNMYGYAEGSPELKAFRRGAHEEANVRIEGMTLGGHEVYNYVEVVAKQGRSAEEITTHVARIFTAGWTWRKRARLALRLVTGK
jgi:hypothetical protein